MQYYHLADKFGRGFEEAFAALRRLEDSKSDLERIPSVDEKLQLSYDIFKVSSPFVCSILRIKLEYECSF